MALAKHVLIVEDEPNVRLVFRAALVADDTLVSTAEDGESALRWLKHESVDLVLLDLQMPGIGGIELLRRLREAGNDVPVVIVSAHDQVPNVVQAMRLGAIDFLSKPTTPEVLRKVVAEILARRASHTPTTKPEPKAVPASGEQSDALTRAKDALNRRSFGEAEAALKQVISNDSPAEGYYLLGILHELRDEKDAAYRSYRASLQADPNFEPARLHLLKYFNDRLM